MSHRDINVTVERIPIFLAESMKARNKPHPFLSPLLEYVLDKCRPLTWHEREKVVGAAIVAIFKGCKHIPDINPNVEYPKLIAAVIEELGNLPVEDEPQAILYSLSSENDHVQAGEAWLAIHQERTPLLRR
jgi:hypothetical protein